MNQCYVAHRGGQEWHSEITVLCVFTASRLLDKSYATPLEANLRPRLNFLLKDYNNTTKV